MQGPGSFTNIIANRVIIEGPDGELLVYSGTPALNNLLLSITSASVNDAFGNLIPNGGDTTYNFSGTFAYCINIYNGAIRIYTATSLAGPWTSGPIIGYGQVLANPSIQDGWSISGYVSIATQVGVVEFMSNGNPYSVIVDSPIVAKDPSQPDGLHTPESWHSIVPVTGFATGNPTPRYKRYPDNTVHLTGQITLTAAQIAGTAFFTLPSGYVPQGQVQHFYTPNNLSGAVAGSRIVYVNTFGNLGISPAGSNGNVVDLDGIVIALD